MSDTPNVEPIDWVQRAIDYVNQYNKDLYDDTIEHVDYISDPRWLEICDNCKWALFVYPSGNTLGPNPQVLKTHPVRGGMEVEYWPFNT
jgi:hypothetical protein